MPGTKVIVCFLPSTSELLQKSWLNTAAARLAPPNAEGRKPMVHAELFFPAQEDAEGASGLSCGIHYGGKVFMSPKRFSKKDWIFHSFSCDQSKYNKMKKFCADQVGGGFNYAGYFTPCNIASRNRYTNATQQSWYCSELVASALQAADLIEPGLHAHQHPDQLYQIVRDSEITYLDTGRRFDTSKLQL